MINEQILSALTPLNVPIYFMEAEENNDSIYIIFGNEATYQGKEESIESSNVTLTGVFMPLISNGKVSARANSTDEGAEEFTSKWFTAVQTEFTPAMALAKKVK